MASITEYLTIGIGLALGEGPFTSVGEGIPDEVQKGFPCQPAQFQARHDWSHESVRQAGIDGDRTLQLYSLGDTQTAFHDKLEHNKPTPSDPFRDDAVVGACHWSDHCWDLWCLFRTLQNKKWATSSCLTAFLVLIRAGLESQLGIMASPLMITETANGDGNSNQVLFSEPMFGYKSAEKWEAEMAGRRFFAGSANVDNLHWVSILWDRQRGHLYIYDTFISGRRKRVQLVAQAMSHALQEAGMPYSFRVFAPPLSIQPNAWCCGYLSLYTLMVQIRGLIGVDHDTLTHVFPMVNLAPKQTSDFPPPAFIAPALPARDWQATAWVYRLPSRHENATEWDRVKFVIATMIMDELGVSDWTFRDSADKVETLSCPRGLRIRNWPHRGTARSKLPVDQVFSNAGGYQYVDLADPTQHVLPYESSRIVAKPKSNYGLAEPMRRHFRNRVPDNLQKKTPESAGVLASLMEATSPLRKFANTLPALEKREQSCSVSAAEPALGQASSFVSMFESYKVTKARLRQPIRDNLINQSRKHSDLIPILEPGDLDPLKRSPDSEENEVAWFNFGDQIWFADIFEGGI